MLKLMDLEQGFSLKNDFSRRHSCPNPPALAGGRLREAINIEADRLLTRSLCNETKAENYDDYENVSLKKGERNLNCVSSQTSGWVCFKNVELSGKNKIELRATTEGMPGSISVHLDDLDAAPLVKQAVQTDYPWEWKSYKDHFETTTGLHDVYVYFNGSVSLNTIQIC